MTYNVKVINLHDKIMIVLFNKWDKHRSISVFLYYNQLPGFNDGWVRSGLGLGYNWD